MSNDSPPPAAAPLEDRVALSLGRMVLRFSVLESVTRYALLHVLDVADDDETRIEALLATLPFRRLRDALAATVHDIYGDGAEWLSLRELLARIDEVEARRNALVHSAWIHSDLPARITREKLGFSGGGKRRTDRETFDDVVTLDKFVADVNDLGEAMIKWYTRKLLEVAPTSK